MSYRQAGFSRIKERNAKRIEDCIRSGKVQVLFNSMPVEIRPASVVIDVAGSRREIANDYVWILAGGTPPNDFLKKIGVQIGDRDLTSNARSEAEESLAAPRELAARR